MANPEGFKFFKGSVIHEHSVMNNLNILPLAHQKLFWHNAAEENMRYRSMEAWYRNGCIGGYSVDEDIAEETERSKQT